LHGTFVQNRIDEIHKLVPNAIWHYVPSGENPSDMQSRGISSKKFLSSSLWLHGPTFLTDPTSWPNWEISNAQVDNIDSSDSESFVCTAITVASLEPILPYTNYSKLNKLFKITILVQRFIHNLKHPHSKRTSTRKVSRNAIHVHHNFSIKEFDDSESYWIKHVQRIHYATEINILSSNASVKNSLIPTLNLFLDNEILRCKKRIDNANLPYNTKFPIFASV
jgi:hypothetical protein